MIAFYNVIGVLDICSTVLALESGYGEEFNPMMRAIMERFGGGWVAAKLTLQALVSFMVLWFPHRIVLSLFAAAVLLNTLVVLNNFRIGFGY